LKSHAGSRILHETTLQAILQATEKEKITRAIAELEANIAEKRARVAE
jgi:hypothetical protein